MSISIKLGRFLEDKALRVGDFALLPDFGAFPSITSQPFQNFQQYTWVEKIVDGVLEYQSISVRNDSITMLIGTEFSIGLRAADLSNVYDVNDTSGLSYAWRRDGSPIYELNSLNGGIGTSFLLVKSKESTVSSAGIYTCDVTNAYGTIQSRPLTVNIIDPSNHPKLYKNLLANGDGDGGLSGWEADNGIKTLTFIKEPSLVRYYGSFHLGGFINYNGFDKFQGNINPDGKPWEFYFCAGNHTPLFHFWHSARKEKEPTYLDINVPTDPNVSWTGWLLDSIVNITAQIIPNEDYYGNKSNFAAFFPGIAWLDTYNKNQDPVISLLGEMNNYTNSYFTRDKIQFEKFGGVPTISLRQIVSLAGLEGMVDGNVYGVKYLTSQFFAYVGAGITGYKIKVTLAEGVEKVFNYYIQDSETVFNSIKKSPATDDERHSFTEDVYKYFNHPLFDVGVAGLGPTINRFELLKIIAQLQSEGKPVPQELLELLASLGSSTLAAANTSTIVNSITSAVGSVSGRYALQPYSDIEIIPLVEDRTTITLDYLDELDEVLKSEVLEGPQPSDVWAIKEKVYFPLTLYSLFEFLKPSSNNITVFGQKYTDTDALLPFFNQSTNGSLFKKGLTVDLSSVKDSHAKFLLRKYTLHSSYNRLVYPDGYLQDVDSAASGGKTNGTHKALLDSGAAAMFGIGKTIKIPARARKVRVSVSFTHLSEAMRDPNPELKDWNDQEIYVDVYGQNSGVSRRLVSYGNPRCGITKMKFIIGVNELGVSDKYPTYFLPPPNATVLGLQKATFGIADYYNSALSPDYFEYKTQSPTGVPDAPQVPDVFALAQTINETTQNQNYLLSTQHNLSGDPNVVTDDDDLGQCAPGDFIVGDPTQQPPASGSIAPLPASSRIFKPITFQKPDNQVVQITPFETDAYVNIEISGSQVVFVPAKYMLDQYNVSVNPQISTDSRVVALRANIGERLTAPYNPMEWTDLQEPIKFKRTFEGTLNETVTFNTINKAANAPVQLPIPPFFDAGSKFKLTLNYPQYSVMNIDYDTDIILDTTVGGQQLSLQGLLLWADWDPNVWSELVETTT